MKLISYVRVSTDEQAREGLSLGAQDARHKAYAEAMEHQIVASIIDDVTGKHLKRPGIQRALKMLRKGEADGILVTKIDRLTRRTRDLEELVEKYFGNKHTLVSLAEKVDTSTAMGRAMLSLTGMFAQLERELIAERTRDALQYKKQRGAKLGALPLGFRRIKGHDGKVVRVELDDAEQRVLGRALELERAGNTLTQIAAALTAEGHHTKRGGKWHLTTVRKTLARAHAARAATQTEA